MTSNRSSMPAMSRPQTARDMDLLKSLLKNESNNSQENTDEEQDAGKEPPQQRSRSNSVSSSGSRSNSSSITKPNTKHDPKSRSRSNSSSGSSRSRSPADVKENTSAQSSGSFWSDFDIQSKPKKGTTNNRSESNQSWYEKKVKSDDEETQSNQYSSLSSVVGNEKSKDGEIKRTTKKKANATKKQKKSGKKRTKPKSKSNDITNGKEQEVDDYENDFESEVGEDIKHYASEDGCIRIDMGETSNISKQPPKAPKQVSNGGEKVTPMQQFYSNRKQAPRYRRHDLTDRAKDTMHLYPEKLARPDRLEKNYQELQSLLEDQFIKHEDALNRQIVRDTKQSLNTYKHHQQGYVGSLRPPSEPPQRIRRPRLWSAHKEPTSVQTQADLDDRDNRHANQYRNRPQSAKGYYFIDTTKPETKKRVSFVYEGRKNSLVKMENDTSRTQSRGRAIMKSQRRSRQDVRSADSSKTRSHSPSEKDGRSGSESSKSRSRSRSHTPDKRTDHHLKHTDNPRLHNWLKEKNRIHRRQQREERKKEKLKKKEEAEAEKVKLKRQEKIEGAVQKWMKDKQRGNRLLRKRPTDREHGDITISDEKITIETVDLQNGEKVQAEEVAEDQVKQTEDQTQASDKNDTVEVNMKGEESLKCTCGFVEHAKSREDEQEQLMRALKLRLEKEVSRQANRKPRPPNAKKLNVNPSSASGKITLTASHSAEECKKRLSYENWIKQKRTEDMEKRKRDRKKSEELLSQSDPETDAIVSSVAKKRIDNIMQGKKKVSTGIKAVDDEANKSLGDKTGTVTMPTGGRAEEVTPSSGSSARYYRWAGNKTDKTAGSNRPVSAPITAERNGKDRNENRPDSSGRPRTSSGDERRSRSVSPKPKTKSTKAYSSVKYQRRSWDEFSDYVWDKLNDGDGEIKAPDSSDGSEAQPRPEPQGADDIIGAPKEDEASPETSNSDGIKSTDETATDSKSVNESNSQSEVPESTVQAENTNEDDTSDTHVHEVDAPENTSETDTKDSEVESTKTETENDDADSSPEKQSDLEVRESTKSLSASTKKVRFSEHVDEWPGTEYPSDDEDGPPTADEPGQMPETGESDSGTAVGESTVEPVEDDVFATDTKDETAATEEDQKSEEPTSVFLTSENTE